jgi:hypothetical protein
MCLRLTRVVGLLVTMAALVLATLFVAACGRSSFDYAGVWGDEENEIPALLIEPDGSAWTVRDTLGRSFTYETKDDGLVCTSGAPVTLIADGDKLVSKDPVSAGGWEVTLVRLSETPSPWPSSQ